MTPAELAKHLVVGLAGPDLTVEETAWLKYYQPAGVILFSRNCQNEKQLGALCGRLCELVPTMEIMVDHEGGPVSQLAAALGRPPVAYALGQLDDLSLTARVHQETGRRLRAVGVTRVLAPVADVLTELKNPVIGARAFGPDVQRVERHTVAAVSGLLAAGMTVCLKHWPGHGGSLTDSHLTGAEVGGGALLAPFTAGLSAGADTVMVGHLATRDDSDLPATLDRNFLDHTADLLHQNSGCRPALMADDITMGGLRAGMAAQGIAAGDGLDSGLVDPALLSVEWLEALLAAGCGQLLIRGLPLAALPLPTGITAAASAVQLDLAEGEDGYEKPGDTFGDTFGNAYSEARVRLWALASVGFAAPGEDLLWWDGTVDDRWLVAGGDRGPVREQLAPVLKPHFRNLISWQAAVDTGGPITRLLVTSHRPLPEAEGRDARLAQNGVCLVMGHPSLAGVLAGYLGPGWTVGAVYDISGADLFPPG